ncbi:MAG: hypothetical protein KF832_24260 [Caldilineaceae bacterium]|nr:hypothetical protein [Caldilineaceae bacterium]
MRRLLLVLWLVLMPLATACQPVADPNVSAVVDPLAGSAFNPFFPKDQGDYDVFYTQEKEGFAQAQLNEKGVEVATLSIADTANNLSALEKFKQSTEEISGYPAAAVGALGTAILVADRFQVQVRSKDAAFTAADRADWLAQFDLAGLAALP